ncbi:MAG: GreA/GreB family elongation factor [Candidatus Uhrbacteria bacterium]
MRLPTRRSETLVSTTKVSDNFLSPAAIKKYQTELDDLLKNQRAPAIKEVQRTAEMGDFSENAAYQMAKWRLRGINYRITTLEEKLKSAIPIDIAETTSGVVRIGSTVVVEVAGQEMEYQILGSQESNPLKGLVSYLSPLGAALLNHVVGDVVVVKVGEKEVEYRIVSVG